MLVTELDTAQYISLFINKSKQTKGFKAKAPAEVDDIRIRASSVADVFKCRAIPLIEKTQWEPMNTERGKDVHIESERANFDLTHRKDSIDPLYTKICLNLSKKYLWNTEVKVSRKIKPLMSLTGAIDFIAVSADTAYIIDLKAGFNSVKLKENNQLLAYCWAVLNYFPTIQKFKVKIAQNGVCKKENNLTWSRKKIDKFGEKLLSIDENQSFRLGPQCMECFKSVHCPAGSHIVRVLRNRVLADSGEKKLKDYLHFFKSLGIMIYNLKTKIEYEQDVSFIRNVQLEAQADTGVGEKKRCKQTTLRRNHVSKRN